MQQGSIKIIIGACLFGLIPLFVRYGSELSIASIALGRAIFASLFARVYLLLNKENIHFSFRQIKSPLLKHFIIWTLFLTFAIVTYFLSISYGDISIAGVLMGVHPIFVVLFVFLFFKEKITRNTLFSCLLSIIGIVLIAGFNSDISMKSFVGSLFALASAFFLGLNFTYYLKYLKNFSAGKLVFYQNILQIPLLIPFAIFDPGTLTSKGLISISILGIVCTGIAYFLVYSGSQTVKKQHIGILQIIENIIPIIFGTMLFNEQISFFSCIGIVLIFSSIFFISFENKQIE
jgi:drug/metabolite transporter (DMT)-like permease